MSTDRMYKAVLFDLGNTLVSYYRKEEFGPILYNCLHNVASIVDTPESVSDDLFARALELNREARDYTVRPLIGRLISLFPTLSDTGSDAHEAACRAFMEPVFDRAVLADDALGTLDAVRSAGLRTGLISNTPWGSPSSLWREELSRHGLAERMDATVFCVDVGFRKPHPAVFSAALKELGASADESLFVGDDPVWDVEGARRSGLRPVLISETGEPVDGVHCIESLSAVYNILV